VVDLTPPCERLIDHPLHVISARDVRAYAPDAAWIGFPELGGRPVQQRLVDIDQRDVCALGEECRGDPVAQPAAGAGDNDGLVCE
jgi:hypothetical protein